MLCEYKTRKPGGGFMCGLSMQSPDFDYVCDDIRLEKTFFRELKLSYLHYRAIAKHKIWNIIWSVLISLLDLVAIGWALFSLYYSYQIAAVTSTGSFYFPGMSLISTGPFYFTGFSFVVFAYGLGSYYGYLEKLKKVRLRYQKADAIARLYVIEYDIKILPKKHHHGIEEGDAELVLRY